VSAVQRPLAALHFTYFSIQRQHRTVDPKRPLVLSGASACYADKSAIDPVGTNSLLQTIEQLTIEGGITTTSRISPFIDSV